MAKKENVHLKLSEELAGIDVELDKAMEALSETNLRIDTFLSDDEGDGTEVPQDEADEVTSDTQAESTSEPETTETTN